MTQTRPRLDDDLAAEISAYAAEWHISFNTAVRILLRVGLRRGLRPDDEKKEKP